MKKNYFILFIILSSIILTSCTTSTTKKDTTTPKDNTDNQTPKPVSKVDKIINSMTLEEKIGQMFIVNLEELETGTIYKNYFPKTINSKQIENLKKYNVGGIIYFSGNLTTKEALIEYNKNLQLNSKYPLFISIDEEGGKVSRLGSRGNMGVTKFPPMRSIGDTKDTKQAYNVGVTLGSELKTLGFNLDFAPIADVNTNPNNPVIGDRSFGDNQNLVASMVSEEVKGMQEQNISATLKHFPGHGDTSTDTHTNRAVVNSDINRLKQVELVPFESGIKADVDFILTAHISLPNITGDYTPATMSKEVLTNILRKDLEFKGIIITDALDMDAISKYYTSEEIALNCINAGVDILLMPKNFEEMYSSLLKLVNDGKISEERINESLRRILDVKIERGLID